MDMTVADLGEAAREVALSGRLDMAGVDRIEAKFNAAAISNGQPLLLDLGSVEFVSSLGVRMLITTAKAMRQRALPFVTHVPAGPVREMLTVAGIDSLIPMFETLEEARATILRR
ncbi:MAG: STAS domain-containing protein [Gemmatimonas sp.]|jgi:anti-anti-sigma factor